MLLVLIRYLNLILFWNVTRLELTNDPLTRVGDYRFLGFSNYENAKKKFMKTIAFHMKDVSIATYFDSFHPAVFLINNKSGKKTFVNLGHMIVFPEKGFTALFFHPSEILETRRKETGRQAHYYGYSLFSEIYKKLAGNISGTEIGERVRKQGISFILKPVKDSNYLKIPYYLHFYLSLLIILILAAYYGRIFYISFFYFLELFLFFDFKKTLFTVPFSWLINLLDIDISETTTAIISAILVTIFVIGGFLGIFNIRKEESREYNLTAIGKGLIIFFLLLPFFLRF